MSVRTTFSRLYALQQVRFVAVGLLNTGFSYAVYAMFLFAGFGFKSANLAALVLGILFSFRTQGALVFRNNDGRLFLRFVAGWTVIYLLTISAIGLFVELGANAYLAGFMALPVSTVLSYLVQKHFVFRPR